MESWAGRRLGNVTQRGGLEILDEGGQPGEPRSRKTESVFVDPGLYRTGHTLVDNQHQELFRIFDRLLTSPASEVSALLLSLMDYTQYHFATEEALMRDAGIPDLHGVRHRTAHRQFEEFVRQAQSLAPHQAESVRSTVITFLAQWFSNHIRYTDAALLREINGPVTASHPFVGDAPPDQPEMLEMLESLSQLWDTTGTQLFHLVAQADRWARLHSLYRALVGSVDALLNITTESSLWLKFCENLTDGTPFNAVWLGQPGPDGRFRVVGRGGPNIAQIDEARPILSESSQASLVVQAWRSRSAIWTNDTMHNEQLAPWHASFARNAWYSLLAVPVDRNQAPWAVLAFSSDQPHIFDTNTVDLCRRISLLASHGIDAWDVRQSLHAQQQEQARLARTDALTRLPNRLGMEEYLARALAQDHPFILALVDLDDFKLINDQWGHHLGDRVLQAVAVRLRRAARQEDFVCRMGGDEFVLIVHFDGARSAWPRQRDGLVHRLARVMKVPLRHPIGDASMLPQMTMGMAWYPQHARTASELLRLADKAMYDAKRNKRDRTQWWHMAD